MDTFWQDIRYGLRMLAKNPGFTAVVVLSLALGIGGNTTIFSLVNAILLRPLPYSEPERLYTIWETIPKLHHLFPSLPVSAPHFLEWRKQATVFDQIAIISPTAKNLTGAGEPERLGAARVSANFFSLLGVRAQLGRAFLDGEDQPGRDPVVVISDSLWRRRFQADSAVIGKVITLDGQGFIVVGVLPRDFPFPRGRQLHQYVAFESSTDLWVPIVFTPGELAELGEFNHVALGRLKKGVTLEQAQAELNLIQAHLAQKVPELVGLGAFLLPLQEALVGDVRQGLALMLAAVGFVLLIVCVNVANLLLARAPLRRREIAIRLALGAGRGRLIAQMLIESLVLALAGGALGVLLALWSIEALATRLPVDLPRLEEVRVDGQVLLYALLISLTTGVVFGLWPALRATQLKLHETLKGAAAV